MGDPVPDSFFPFSLNHPHGRRAYPTPGEGPDGLSFGTPGIITASERTFEQEVEADGQSSLT